ncbi:hypothetical protein RSAG8_05333, partial [Rhizoctonia solani AG-8 WAC10335]
MSHVAPSIRIYQHHYWFQPAKLSPAPKPRNHPYPSPIRITHHHIISKSPSMCNRMHAPNRQLTPVAQGSHRAHRSHLMIVRRFSTMVAWTGPDPTLSVYVIPSRSMGCQ